MLAAARRRRLCTTRSALMMFLAVSVAEQWLFCGVLYCIPQTHTIRDENWPIINIWTGWRRPRERKRERERLLSLRERGEWMDGEREREREETDQEERSVASLSQFEVVGKAESVVRTADNQRIKRKKERKHTTKEQPWHFSTHTHTHTHKPWLSFNRS